MALNGLNCAYVPLRNYSPSLTNSLPLPGQAHWTAIWSQRWGPDSWTPARKERLTKERRIKLSFIWTT